MMMMMMMIEVESHLGEVNFFHINETRPVWWGELKLFVDSHWSVHFDFVEERRFSTSPLSPEADR